LAGLIADRLVFRGHRGCLNTVDVRTGQLTAPVLGRCLRPGHPDVGVLNAPAVEVESQVCWGSVSGHLLGLGDRS